MFFCKCHGNGIFQFISRASHWGTPCTCWGPRSHDGECANGAPTFEINSFVPHARARKTGPNYFVCVCVLLCSVCCVCAAAASDGGGGDGGVGLRVLFYC